MAAVRDELARHRYDLISVVRLLEDPAAPCRLAEQDLDGMLSPHRWKRSRVFDRLVDECAAARTPASRAATAV